MTHQLNKIIFLRYTVKRNDFALVTGETNLRILGANWLPNYFRIVHSAGGVSARTSRIGFEQNSKEMLASYKLRLGIL